MRRKRAFHVADILILTALTAVGLALWIADERERGGGDGNWQTPDTDLIMITEIYAEFFVASITAWLVAVRSRQDPRWSVDFVAFLASDPWYVLATPVRRVSWCAGTVIIAEWTLLAIGRSLDRKNDWVDAFGFALGVGWIMMLFTTAVSNLVYAL